MEKPFDPRSMLRPSAIWPTPPPTPPNIQRTDPSLHLHMSDFHRTHQNLHDPPPHHHHTHAHMHTRFHLINTTTHYTPQRHSIPSVPPPTHIPTPIKPPSVNLFDPYCRRLPTCGLHHWLKPWQQVRNGRVKKMDGRADEQQNNMLHICFPTRSLICCLFKTCFYTSAFYLHWGGLARSFSHPLSTWSLCKINTKSKWLIN